MMRLYVQVVLRTASTREVGSTNAFGDKQLQVGAQGCLTPSNLCSLSLLPMHAGRFAG